MTLEALLADIHKLEEELLAFERMECAQTSFMPPTSAVKNPIHGHFALGTAQQYNQS
jgi:hypothetical protein